MIDLSLLRPIALREKIGDPNLVDVKNQQEKPNQVAVEDFLEKAALYGSQHSGKTILLAFLSLGGFTEKALELCQQRGIAWTTELQYF